MITLFILEGSIQYLDDQDDVFSKLRLYEEYCKANRIPIQELKY